jgi:hypothetical protein
VILDLLILDVLVGVCLILESRCYEPLLESQTLRDRAGAFLCLVGLAFVGAPIVLLTHVVRGIRRLLG